MLRALNGLSFFRFPYFYSRCLVSRRSQPHCTDLDTQRSSRHFRQTILPSVSCKTFTCGTFSIRYQAMKFPSPTPTERQFLEAILAGESANGEYRACRGTLSQGITQWKPSDFSCGAISGTSKRPCSGRQRCFPARSIATCV